MKNGKISDAGRKDSDMAAYSKSYLVFYNTAQTAGWSFILFQTIKYLAKYKTVTGLWKMCGTSVIIFQTLAALEVVHSAIRIVPSNPVTTLVQVASRLFQLWGIMMPIEKVQNSPTLALAILAWSVTEVVRYSYYCAQILGKPSKLHTWCRYSLFYVLYPCGVTGEISNMLVALEVIKQKNMYSILLPNPLNISFSFYYFNILVLLSYIPLFPHLFLHMVRQRKKILGEDAPKKVK